MAARPSFRLSMIIVSAIGHNFEELLITWYSANIFGGSRTRAVDTGREAGKQIKCQKLFNLYRMAPIVAKIIGIVECWHWALSKIQQANGRFVQGHFIEPGRRVVCFRDGTKAKRANAEFMHVIIPPVERCLDDLMEHPEIPRQRHDQLPPDWRFDIRNRDAKLRCVELTIRHGAE